MSSLFREGIAISAAIKYSLGEQDLAQSGDNPPGAGRANGQYNAPIRGDSGGGHIAEGSFIGCRGVRGIRVVGEVCYLVVE